MKINKKAAAIIGLLMLVLYLVSFLLSYMFFSPNKTDLLTPLAEKNPEAGGMGLESSSLPEISEAEMINILLIGYGGAGHPGGNLADVLMVVNINLKNKKAALISIPRDAWVILPAKGEEKGQKVNTVFVEGGGELAKQTVELMLGIPVNYYAAISFSGFVNLVDVLGGIEVEVPVGFNDYYYPVKGLEDAACGKTAEEVAEILSTKSGFEIDKEFPCRFEYLHFDKGRQLMSGDRALKFVRSRHSTEHGGDFARSVRQQALLLGIKEKLLNLNVFSDFVPVYSLVKGNVRTDIDEKSISQIIEENQALGKYPIVQVNLTTNNVFKSFRTAGGQYILLPKSGADAWDQVHEYVREELGIEK